MDLYYFMVFACFSFAMGCCIASFLNVCIWRIPREESVAFPPSHCPNCNARIRWYQNIPIVSWCCLRGKCASCGKPISVRYTVVELMGGLLFLLAYLQWGMPFFFGGAPAFGLVGCRSLWMVPAEWAIAAWLMLLAFIDLENSFFPSNLLYAGMVAGPLLSALVPELQGETRWLPALCWSVGAEAVGFGAFALLRWAGGLYLRKVKKVDKDALGDGDPFLLAAIGSFFGPWAVLFTVMASAFTGALVGTALILKGRTRLGGYTAIPYGPYLALGAVLWMYWGPAVLHWYLRLSALTPEG